MSESQLFEMMGAIHLHSDFSDGTMSIPEIALIAEGKGLDFIMFCDHNTLAPKKQGLEGWHGKILVLIGCELNDPDDRNHYLAFRIQKEIPEGQWPEDYVQQVKNAGGFGIIAHPAEKRQFSDAYPAYPWTAWHVDGFDGIEIWNQLSEWAEGVTRRNFAWRILHPLRSIRFPVWDTLNRWDRLNLSRRVVGIGGIDVHAHRIPILGFISIEIYPYKVQFKSIRTHILLDLPVEPSLDFTIAESRIFDALSHGHCFISNYALGNARGFRFWAVQDDHCFPMGSRVIMQKTIRFFIRVPKSAQIRFLRNGAVIQNKMAAALDFEMDRTGVYRVEVFRKKRGWIYSNPIVVLDH